MECQFIPKATLPRQRHWRCGTIDRFFSGRDRAASRNHTSQAWQLAELGLGPGVEERSGSGATQVLQFDTNSYLTSFP